MVEQIAGSAFARGCAYVEAQGRPLEIARLRHRLGRGPASAVVASLAPFQNLDGGFGHGLEPDIATPASTAIATSIGFQALLAAQIGDDEPMVRDALAWLEASFDGERGVWPIVGPQVDLAPHAFWWDSAGDLAGRWNGFRFNPSAELLGVLYAYRAAAAPGLIIRAEQALIDALANGRTLAGAYDIKAGLRLLRGAATPSRVKAAIEPPLRAAILALDADDAHAPVLELAPVPGEALTELVSPRVAAAFDQLLGEQQADGSWAPFWDWSAVDAAAWSEAERDWRAILTRQAVEVLAAYGRTDGPT